MALDDKHLNEVMLMKTPARKGRSESKKRSMNKLKITNPLITRKTLIGELIKKYPDAATELNDFGFYCVGCHIATWETIEQAAELHGVNADKLVAELNAKIVDST